MVCPKCGGSIEASTPLGARLAMKAHRKLTCPERPGRKEAIVVGTTQEHGQQLQAMAESVRQSINGAKANVSEALNNAISALAQCKNAAEDPVGQVATMLGEDHMGTTAIEGASAAVSDAIDGVLATIQQANIDLANISGAADTLAFVYNNVGQDIQRTG